MFLHISIQAGVYIHFIPTHILTAHIEYDLYTTQKFHDLASQNGTKTRKVVKVIRAQEQICRNYSAQAPAAYHYGNNVNSSLFVADGEM